MAAGLTSGAGMSAFYHGGKPGLKPGDYIEPPSVTGVRTFAGLCREINRWRRLPRALLLPDCRDDRVYVTSSRAIAFDYACTYTLLPFFPGEGTVYRVIPEGRITRDPGTPNPENFECERARVESVEFVNAPRPQVDSDYRRALNAFMVVYLAYLKTASVRRREPI